MRLPYIFVSALLMISTGCGHGHSEHEHEHEHSHAPGHVHGEAEEHEDEDEHGHDHSDEIILSPADAERFGVVVEEAVYQPFSKTIKVSGEINAPSASIYTVAARSSGKITLASDIIVGGSLKTGQTVGHISAAGFEGGDPTAAAALRLEAARKELDRLTPLFKEGLVSQKDYIAAQNEYNQALATTSGSKNGSTLVSPASGRISKLFVSQNQFVNSGEPILELTDTRKLTLRAYVPVRFAGMVPEIVSARFSSPASDKVWDLTEMNGRLTSGSTNMVTEGGYIPVQFDFDNNSNSVAGTYADVYLVCQTADSCIALPRTAITEELGTKFVFVQVDDHGYEKRPVATGNSDGKRTAILSGIEPGDKVVTSGTVFVKLAQTKNVMPEGHSHSH